MLQVLRISEIKDVLNFRGYCPADTYEITLNDGVSQQIWSQPVTKAALKENPTLTQKAKKALRIFVLQPLYLPQDAKKTRIIEHHRLQQCDHPKNGLKLGYIPMSST
ncbi:hypothetical protein PALA21_01377 [Pseudomonas aeruginosa]|nr:hypothetical protein [Pseudomonas aeruginosa]